MDLQGISDRGVNTSFSASAAKAPAIRQQPEVVTIDDDSDSDPSNSSAATKGCGQRKVPPSHPEHGPVPKNTLREKRTYTVNPTRLKNLWNVCGDRVISLESEHGKVPQRWLSMIARNADQYLSARDLFTVTVSTNPGEVFAEEFWVDTESECEECEGPMKSSGVREDDSPRSSPLKGSTPPKAAMVTPYQSPAGKVKKLVSTPHPKVGEKLQRGHLNGSPTGNCRVRKRSSHESEDEDQDDTPRSKKRSS